MNPYQYLLVAVFFLVFCNLEAQIRTESPTYEYQILLKNKRTLRGSLNSNSFIKIFNEDSSIKLEHAVKEIEYWGLNVSSHIGKYFAPEVSMQTYAFTGNGEYVDLSGSGINLGIKYLFQFSNVWGVNTGFVFEYYSRNFLGSGEEITSSWQPLRTVTNDAEMFMLNVPLHFSLLTGEWGNPNFYLHLGSGMGIFFFRKKIVRVEDSNNSIWESIDVRRTGFNIHFFDLGIGARIPFSRNFALLLNNRTALGLLSYPGGVGISIQSGFCMSFLTRIKTISYP